MASPKSPSAELFPAAQRRPRLLSSSVSRAEHSTYELGGRDGSPRVIAYVKASQGFDWNQEIFLPRDSEAYYGRAEYGGWVGAGRGEGERVHEIRLGEEEGLLPV